MILSEAIEIFVDAKLADGIADTTASWYRSRLVRLCKDLDDCDLDQIDAMRLRRFIVSLRSVRILYKKHPYRDQQEGTLSPSTRHGYVRVARQFFGWFVHEGLLQENPASNIKLPKIAPKDVTEKTMRALLRACRGEEPSQ